MLVYTLHTKVDLRSSRDTCVPRLEGCNDNILDHGSHHSFRVAASQQERNHAAVSTQAWGDPVDDGKKKKLYKRFGYE